MIVAVDDILSAASSDQLSKHDLLMAKLFRNQHSDIVFNIINCPLYLIPVNSIGAGGITFSFLESIEWMRFESMKDFKVLLNRIHFFPQQADEYITSLQEGIKRNFVASHPMIQGVENQLMEIINGTIPELDIPLSIL